MLPLKVELEDHVQDREGQERLAKFKYVFFLEDRFPPEANPRELFGSKGAGLRELSQAELPVPEAAIITTLGWRRYKENQDALPPDLWQEIVTAVRTLEQQTGSVFGDSQNPVFFSVRSGAPETMPGRMITIINLGLNDQTVQALAKRIGETGAWQAYLELIIHFGRDVYGLEEKPFLDLRQAVSLDQPVAELQALVEKAKELCLTSGSAFPQDPYEQLRQAGQAVYQSYDSPRAKDFRTMHGLAESMGTALIIQRMVFGNNQNGFSGSGVISTRDPRTYEDEPFLVFAHQRQGFAVVAEEASGQSTPLATLPANIAQELRRICAVATYQRLVPQQLEITIENDCVYVLQTRDAHLSNLATFRRLHEAWQKGLITTLETIKLIRVQTLESLLKSSLDPLQIEQAEKEGRLLETGLPLSTCGYAAGRLVASFEAAKRLGRRNPVVLWRLFKIGELDRLPGNVRALLFKNACTGSHLALDSGSLAGRMPVVFAIAGRGFDNLKGGELVTVDGASGSVVRGRLPLLRNGRQLAITSPERKTVLSWLRAIKQNPWDLMIPLGADHADVVQATQAALQAANVHFQDANILSHKARETVVDQAVFPEDARIPFAVIKPDQKDRLELLLSQALEEGCDATIRTCHLPTMEGTAPYVVFRRPEDIQRFFTDPAFSPHGDYDRLTHETKPTEFLVGRIPKGLLDRNLFGLHWAATATVNSRGELLIQFHPYSPLLRDLETAGVGEIITYLLSYNHEKGEYELPTTKTGENLQSDKKALAWYDYLSHHFTKWWTAWHLPEIMVQIGYLFPPPRFAVPVLEIQGKGDEWMKIYGFKADETKRLTKRL